LRISFGAKFFERAHAEYKGLKRNLLTIPHYRFHRSVMKEIGMKLGEDGSIAELFMCASHKSNNLYNAWGGLVDCTCAHLYLVDYMKIVKPRLIVCFGSPASQWFLKTFGKGMKKQELGCWKSS
jgi:uracil-DNA glycosylase